MSAEKSLSTSEIVTSFIDKSPDPKVPIGRQANLLGIARGSVYYQPVPVSPETLTVMAAIDQLYTRRPFYGSRKIARELGINRKQAQRLMRLMGIKAIYAKPNLSKPHPGHAIYPYLLRGVHARGPNHIWGTDITYIRLAQGLAYLTVFIDWYSRFILSWQLSARLDADFCLAAAQTAVQAYGAPEIANSDQGSQYTSHEYLGFWQEQGTSISMDGRGRAMDNIFTERFWRTLKYEEVYLKEYDSVPDAVQNIGAYIAFYNTARPHQSLGYRTPARVYSQKQKNGLPAEQPDEKVLALNSSLRLS